jgi:hypothetical protein
MCTYMAGAKWQNLESDRALQFRVLGQMDAHAVRADLRAGFVTTEACASGNSLIVSFFQVTVALRCALRGLRSADLNGGCPILDPS